MQHDHHDYAFRAEQNMSGLTDEMSALTVRVKDLKNMPLMWVRHLTNLEMIDVDECVAEGASNRLPRFYLSFLSYVVALGTMLGLSMGEEALPFLFIAF